MYHLRIPQWLLREGRLATPPDSFHVALVGGAHFASLPLLAAGLLAGPAVMQAVAFVLVALGTAALARAAGLARAGGWLAVAMVLGTPSFLLVAITARVDVTLVLVLLAAHLALLEAVRMAAPADAAARRGTVLAAGLLVGAAIAIKPQAGAYAIALIPLGWRAAGGMRHALVTAAAAAAVALPWYVKNQLLTGAPLYPVGAPGWFEPWIARLYGTHLRPASVDASILHALPEARASFKVLDAFFDPGALTIEGEGAFYALSPLLLALPLVLLAWRRASAPGDDAPREDAPGAPRDARPAVAVGLVGLAYALLVVVPFGRINLRYLMPAVPALAVGTAAGVVALGDLLGGRISTGMRRALGAVLIGVALLPLTGALRQRFVRGDAVLVRHALGLASAQEVWRRHPDGTARDLGPTVFNTLRVVPEGGRILMLWEARGGAFPRETYVDVMLSNWSYVAQSPGFGDCLKGTGITHLLVGAGSVEYYVNRGADPRAFLLDRFANFRERCLGPNVTVGPGVELFPLR